MNFGLHPGFTPSRSVTSSPAATAAGLRVLYVPSTYTVPVITDVNVESLLLMDTPSPRTETILAGSFPGGGRIVLAQWGASQLTIAAGSGVILRVPTGKLAKTRAQFSRIELVKTNAAAQEWLISGDLA